MSREHGGVVSRPDVDQLLVHLAWLLDHQRLDEWLGLFTDDAVYWVPLQMDQAEPLVEPLVIEEPRLADEELIDVGPAHDASMLTAHPSDSAPTPRADCEL